MSWLLFVACVVLGAALLWGVLSLTARLGEAERQVDRILADELGRDEKPR